MAENDINQPESNDQKLEGGSYEIIQQRLLKQGDELVKRLEQLNTSRKEVFGALDTRMITQDRILTENNCIPRDMVPLGNKLLFAYEVYMGLKTTIKSSDIFSLYEFKDNSFEKVSDGFLEEESFNRDLKDLFSYYKDCKFTTFAKSDNYLLMVFQIGKNLSDIRAFKWDISSPGTIKYVNSRSERDVTMPEQYDFKWIRTTRDLHVQGRHPHVSIEDRIFVECIEGDLTVKIENNTDNGAGIYSEDVEHKEQSLDDAEIYYAIMKHMILLKILPFREEKFRYLIYNEKNEKVTRIDDIEECAIRLPDDDGLIFPGGYYLENGDSKIFELQTAKMRYRRTITSPNGEDYIYVFYNDELGEYILLQYNVIDKKVKMPIYCHGYAIYDDGKLIFFKNDDDPKKSHAIQIWQTPFTTEQDFRPADDSMLTTIGNKELVHCISDLKSIINLVRTENIYLGLYHQIVKASTRALDLYHWMDKTEVFNVKEVLQQLNKTSKSAIDEYEKVVQIRANTANSINSIEKEVQDINNAVSGRTFKTVDEYVDALSSLQMERGKIISLKELRYSDQDKVKDLEENVKSNYENVAKNCTDFLLTESALEPYVENLNQYEEDIKTAEKLSDLDEIHNNIENVNNSLNLLMELVNNLKIDDATKTTFIIENISNVFTNLNQVRASLKKHKKNLYGEESREEFTAQFKLIGQATSNYLDQADTPAKCEELLTRIMVQIEELEGKFSDFDEYIEKLAEKRDEVYSSFNNKKVQLEEALNKRTQGLWNSADRILKSISKRSAQLKDINELNSYFAGDSMVAKVHDIIEQLMGMGDSVKSEDIASRLKTLQQEGSRQLKDRLDLFKDGDNVISFGPHKFLVNKQAVGLTSVKRDDDMYYHLTGTEFFEMIIDDSFEKTRPFWSQELISETDEMYRAEYLAYQLIEEVETYDDITANRILRMAEKLKEKIKDKVVEDDLRQSSSFQNLLKLTQEFMTNFYNDGYEKGIHDVDCTKIFAALYPVYKSVGTLRFHPKTRAYGYIFWFHSPETVEKKNLSNKIKSFAIMNKLTSGSYQHDMYIEELNRLLHDFYENFGFPVEKDYLHYTAEYLFEELQNYAESKEEYFSMNKSAFNIYKEFRLFLKQKGAIRQFNKTITSVQDDLSSRLFVVSDWVSGFITKKSWDTDYYLTEAIAMVFGETMDNSIDGDINEALCRDIDTTCEIENLMGSHSRIENSSIKIDISDFLLKIECYIRETVPDYNSYRQLKRDLIQVKEDQMRLEEYRPKVMSSFVRNKLIDSVYLPLIGANLAKQVGSYGAEKRTDLMGLLLLISPPGYGKTTLMEYLSNRLGLIFMKINCPSIGNAVTSLDPAEAENATARQEVEKLNLALEMGNNVMIYLDDIQHTNSEFLQKFISLCDAQRKIEGVYNGKTKTYDLRGKRVSIIMAGNPYTESGEKFHVPDMLVNRADVYNLGDILGGHEDAFNMSYLENCLTSNRVLNNLASKSQEDVYKMIKIAKEGSVEGIQFETNYSQMEIDEYVSVFKKLLDIQQVVLKVNMQYIYSASQDNAFRTEPTFLLQGSYRNMNKMAEKVAPVMNEKELKQLILDHYMDESQLLTTGAEFNLLRFKELMDWATEEEKERLDFIRKSYQKNLAMGNLQEDDPMSRLLGQVNLFNDKFNDYIEFMKKK